MAARVLTATARVAQGTRFFGVLAGWLAVTTSSACVATEPPPLARGVVVNGPPPAPIAEPRPAPTGPTATWVAGYWHWTGVQYTWVPGHWESPPAGAEWQAPRYSSANGAYVYEPGVWRGASGRLAPPRNPPPRAQPPTSNAFR